MAGAGATSGDHPADRDEAAAQETLGQIGEAEERQDGEGEGDDEQRRLDQIRAPDGVDQLVPERCDRQEIASRIRSGSQTSRDRWRRGEERDDDGDPCGDDALHTRAQVTERPLASSGQHAAERRRDAAKRSGTPARSHSR